MFQESVAMAQRSQGTVKWFNAEKGYGFISRPDGDDLFVHYTEIQTTGGYRSLEEGAKVEFEITQGKKGLQASAVTVVKN
jgi:cold shock protein